MYAIGEKVMIVNEVDRSAGGVPHGFPVPMFRYLGKVVTIAYRWESVRYPGGSYRIEEDYNSWIWHHSLLLPVHANHVSKLK